MTAPPNIADHDTLRLRRSRASRAPALFLHEEAAFEIQERLAEVNKAFTDPLLVGHVTGPLARLFPGAVAIPDDAKLNADRATHDLVVHSFALHWADDPVGQMAQSRLAMKPDGMFLAVMFGGTTLNELRASISESESRLTGGLSPRILPMADLRDLGGLLGRAGFALPVADNRKFTVRYPSLRKLVADLRGMGETNALLGRRRTLAPRLLFEFAEEIYRQHFSDDDGYLQATFELVFLTGWAPAETQPKPLKPGSAQNRLADALGVTEFEVKNSDTPSRR